MGRRPEKAVRRAASVRVCAVAGMVRRGVPSMKRPLCRFPGCVHTNHTRGYCSGHDWQQRHGRELTPIPTERNCQARNDEAIAERRAKYAEVARLSTTGKTIAEQAAEFGVGPGRLSELRWKAKRAGFDIVDAPRAAYHTTTRDEQDRATAGPRCPKCFLILPCN